MKRLRKIQTWASVGAAMSCLAAGPCVPAAPTADCPSGSYLVEGVCASASDSVAVETAPLLSALPADLSLFGTLGYVAGGGYGFVGPNPDTTYSSSFSGGLDERFNALAIYPANSSAYLLSDGSYLDPSGYIVAAGFAQNRSFNTVILIARYNSTGALDTTFNSKGYVLGGDSGFVGGNYHQITSVAIDSEGRIVVAGYGYAGLGLSGNKKAFVARYLPTGQIDTGFNAVPVSPATTVLNGSAKNGYAVSPSTGFNKLNAPTSDEFRAVTVDLATDDIYAVGGSTISGKSRTLLAKYASDGTLEDTVRLGTSTTGTLFDGVVNEERFNGVKIDSSGRIIAVGVSLSGALTSKGLIARFDTELADGLDLTFNSSDTDGYYLTATASYGGNNYEAFNSVMIDSSDQIIAEGLTAIGGNLMRPVMALFNSDGDVASLTPRVLAISIWFDNTTKHLPSASAVMTNGSTPRYFSAGTDYGPTGLTETTALLYANDSTLTLDATFDGTPASTDPATNGGVGYQLGGDINSTDSFLEAATPKEGFLGAALDNDQANIIVCGYSSDDSHTTPLLVRYSVTGALQ